MDMSYTEKIAKLIGDHPGFTRRGDDFIYSIMGLQMLTIYTTKPDMYDRRAGAPVSRDRQMIEETIRYFMKQPHQYSARAIFVVASIHYYVGDGVCARTRYGDVFNIAWEGQQIDIAGVAIQYSMPRALEILSPHETERSRLVSSFARIYGDHPDFYILERGMYMRNPDAGGVDYYIATTGDGDWTIWNMFTGKLMHGTYEQACEEVRKLMLAFDPPLIHSEKIKIRDNCFAYRHLMLDCCRIIAHGDIYGGKPYWFDKVKK